MRFTRVRNAVTGRFAPKESATTDKGHTVTETVGGCDERVRLARAQALNDAYQAILAEDERRGYAGSYAARVLAQLRQQS